MGRPIKARYFTGQWAAKDVEAFTSNGYKGIGSVAIATSGTWYSQGASLSVSAPQWVDGTTATVSAVINATTGWVSSISVTNTGDGYNTTATVTVTPAATQSATGTITSASTTVTNLSGINGVYIGMQAVGTGIPVGAHVTAINTASPYSVTLNKTLTLAGIYGTATTTATVVTFSDTGTNATFSTSLTSADATKGSIKMTAYLTTGSSAVNSAILKQESSARYLVQNNQGRGAVKLVSASPSAGQATLIATDANGNTYYVYKLTGRKAYLTQLTQNGSNAWLFNSDSVAKWTTSTASTGVVSIATN